jgi:hypothetical protein
MKKILISFSIFFIGITNCYSEILNLECVSISQTKHYIQFVVDTDKNLITDNSITYPIVVSTNEFYWKTSSSSSGTTENRINRYSGVYSRSHSGPGLPVPYKCEVGKTRKF